MDKNGADICSKSDGQNLDFEERMDKLRSVSTKDGFVPCSIEGARIVHRPCTSKYIKPVNDILDKVPESDDVDVDEIEDSNELAEEWDELPTQEEAEEQTEEITFEPFYELAIRTVSGRDYICTISFDKDNINISIYDIRYHDDIIEEIAIKPSDSKENKGKLKIGECELEDEIMFTTRDEREFEWNELITSDTDFEPISDLYELNGWIETNPTVKTSEEDSGVEIHITVDYIDNVHWEFNEPVTWSAENNDYVKLIEAFAYSNPSELSESDVYIRHSSSYIEEDTVTSECGNWELLLDYDGLSQPTGVESSDDSEGTYGYNVSEIAMEYALSSIKYVKWVYLIVVIIILINLN